MLLSENIVNENFAWYGTFNYHISPPCCLLQGKDDFERQQKELLDKENIIKQSQIQLGQEQVRHSRFVMLYQQSKCLCVRVTHSSWPFESFRCRDKHCVVPFYWFDVASHYLIRKIYSKTETNPNAINLHRSISSRSWSRKWSSPWRTISHSGSHINPRPRTPLHPPPPWPPRLTYVPGTASCSPSTPSSAGNTSPLSSALWTPSSTALAPASRLASS